MLMATDYFAVAAHDILYHRHRDFALLGMTAK